MGDLVAVLEDVRPAIARAIAAKGARFIADDIASETVARAFAARARAPLDPEECVRWIWSIAWRLLADVYRAPRVTPLPALLSRVERAAPSPEVMRAAGEVERMLTSVPGIAGEDLRAVLVRGLTVAERAAESGRVPKAVRNSIARARKWIRARVVPPVM